MSGCSSELLLLVGGGEQVRAAPLLKIGGPSVRFHLTGPEMLAPAFPTRTLGCGSEQLHGDLAVDELCLGKDLWPGASGVPVWAWFRLLCDTRAKCPLKTGTVLPVGRAAERLRSALGFPRTGVWVRVGAGTLRALLPLTRGQS